MTHIIWVKPEDSTDLPGAEIRGRVGIDDSTVVVEVHSVSRWEIVSIPEGARDESGRVLPGMSIGHSVLPPEGRVFLVAGE